MQQNMQRICKEYAENMQINMSNMQNTQTNMQKDMHKDFKKLLFFYIKKLKICKKYAEYA
jgi:hypothetical protein